MAILKSHSNINGRIFCEYLLSMINLGTTEISEMCEVYFWSLQFDGRINNGHESTKRRQLIKNFVKIRAQSEFTSWASFRDKGKISISREGEERNAIKKENYEQLWEGERMFEEQ